MSEAKETLKAYLIEQAGLLVNDMDRYECLMFIDDWYNINLAVDKLAHGTIQSYSIAGRTVTRQNVTELHEIAQAHYMHIQAFLRGRGAPLIDLRGIELGIRRTSGIPP